MSQSEQLGPRLVFLDTETTGLDPRRHKLWHIGMVVVDPNGDEAEHEWMWWPDLSTADPKALTVNRFYDRAGDRLVSPWSDLYDGRVRYDGDDHDEPAYEQAARVAHNIAHTLDGATIVGACPWFDVSFLVPWLAEHGHVFTGHYHLIDVEALAVGKIAQLHPRDVPEALAVRKPPWKHTDLCRAIGVNPDDFDRHTALGDARMAKAVYEAVMG